MPRIGNLIPIVIAQQISVQPIRSTYLCMLPQPSLKMVAEHGLAFQEAAASRVVTGRQSCSESGRSGLMLGIAPFSLRDQFAGW